MHCAGLRATSSRPCPQRETDLRAFLKALEGIVDHARPVEIHFVTASADDEPINLAEVHQAAHAIRLRHMMLHFAFVAPYEILEPANSRIEGAANGDVDVGMRQVQLAAPIDPDRATGDCEVDTHHEE